MPDSCEVTIDSGEVTLAGTLTLPDRPGPHPGVLMLGGSGPTDRNNDVFFPPIRDHLLRAGRAVLSYDKRGVGGSSGSWWTVGFDDYAADAVAAAAVLRGHPAVDAAAVGMFGHSEGGWVVLHAAAGRDDVAYVVTNSTPGTALAAQERWATAAALRADGVSPADTEAGLAAFDWIMAALARGADFAEVADWADTDEGYQVIAGHGAPLDEPMWGFMRLVHAHDPLPDLLALRCPHLALFGTADPIVPTAESVARLAVAVAARPDRRGRLTVEVFPGADHRIRTDGGSRFAPGYLDTLTRWLGSHPLAG